MASSNPVSLTAKHVFGVNATLKNSLFIVKDHLLVYCAGHNVVVYNLHEKTQ